jgi:hypothetical protein
MLCHRPSGGAQTPVDWINKQAANNAGSNPFRIETFSHFSTKFLKFVAALYERRCIQLAAVIDRRYSYLPAIARNCASNA